LKEDIETIISTNDCWHVYKKSMLVIDGKNNNDDGMFTGKNNSEPKLERPKDEKGRMC
jgi:hypothetical protein